MTDWKPINTAPKHGDYLVWQPAHKSGRLMLSPRMVFKSDAGHVREATFWMPLPAPPKDGSDE
jgi:hypothetical protein